MTTTPPPPPGGRPPYPGPYGPQQQYGQHGQYGAPQQPWGQTPQHYAPAPPPRNGLGTAGFVLGVLALLFSWIPFVGVIGWPLSVLGLILSGFGLQRVTAGKADNKGLSIAGIVLSAIALLVCILWATAFAKAVSDTTSGAVSGAATAAGAAAPAGPTQSVAFGQTYTYKDGLAVTIAAPTGFTPSRSAAPQNVARAVLLTVTVRNGTNQNFEVNTFGNGPKVTFAGAGAQEITDIEQLRPAESATVLPGKSFTYKKAFAVGSGTGDLQAEWTREVLSDPVIFTGQA